MTNADKTNITHLRERGFSYGKIAEMLNLSKESISSYCKRHGLGGRKKTSAEPVNLTVSSCLFCGGIVEQIPHRKAKKFCSDACRMKWWNLHSSQIERKSEQAFLCPVCGKSFSAYASSNQKYCSRKCYGKSKEAAEKEKFQNLLQYQTIMGWVHNLMNDGIITKAEYAKIDTKMHKKYGLSSDSIFRLSA